MSQTWRAEPEASELESESSESRDRQLEAGRLRADAKLRACRGELASQPLRFAERGPESDSDGFRARSPEPEATPARSPEPEATQARSPYFFQRLQGQRPI